jgi:hypothetical protein
MGTPNLPEPTLQHNGPPSATQMVNTAPTARNAEALVDAGIERRRETALRDHSVALNRVAPASSILTPAQSLEVELELEDVRRTILSLGSTQRRLQEIEAMLMRLC